MVKTITAAMDSHLQQETTSLATAWHITRSDGTVFRFTDNSEDITLDIGTGEGDQTYLAAVGYNRTNIANNAELDVDNLDITGIFDNAAITELDLRRGLFDFAVVRIAIFNHQAPEDGVIRMRKGWLGEVIVTPNGLFHTELRGLTDAYRKRLGEFYSKDCRADLGDARCRLPIWPDAEERNTAYAVGDFVRASDLLIFTPGANTVMLVPADGNVDDLILNANGTLGTQAQLQTVISKFGEGAIEFTPSGSVDPSEAFVSYPDRAEYTIGTSEYTIEAWVRFKDLTSSTQIIASHYNNLGGLRAWILNRNATGLNFQASSDGITMQLSITGAFTFVIDTWYHVAVSRDGAADNRLFVDGVQVGSTTNDAIDIVDKSSLLWLGKLRGFGFDDLPLDGFIDDFRFTVGTGLYTTGFTPPTALFTRVDETTLPCADFNDRIYVATVAGTSQSHPAPFFTDITRSGFDFIDGDVTVGTDDITEIVHTFTTGQGPIRLATTGVLPVPLAIDTDYWIIRTDADNFQLALSEADAIALTQIDITSAAGGGTHTVVTSTTDGTVTWVAEEAWSRCFEVTAVNGASPRRKFTVTELTPVSGGPRGGFPNDWFNFGAAFFEDGTNSGVSMEVRDFIEGAGTQDIELFLDLPFDITVGDKGRIFPGCDKLFATCRDKFANEENFVGEPYVPGQDFLGQYPDAR